MIETATEEVPATTRQRERHVCDLCGSKTELGDSSWPAESDWANRAEHDVTVKSVVTHHGYECDGHRRGEAWDFCPKCFAEKVRPLLLTLVEPRKVDEIW